MQIDTLVEGLLDEAVAHRLLRECGHTPGVSFGKNGVDYLIAKAPGFAVRATYGDPLLALVDLMDTQQPCPPAVLAALLPQPAPRFWLRVVVREIESWLLADREGLAGWLGIAPALLPDQPEALADPKRELINLARRSRRRAIREALVPQPGVSASQGPEYALKLAEFVADIWQPQVARRHAPSLERCLVRLSQ